MDADRTRRRQIFEALSPSFGKILPATFFRKPGLPGVDRIHPLIEGIYKPAWSNYALSIASMLKSPYHDQTHFNPDGTWWMHYSPKAGGMDIAANAALVRCMTDSEPLLVLKQVATKPPPPARAIGCSAWAWSSSSTRPPTLPHPRCCRRPVYRLPRHSRSQDDLIETALRLEALEDWQPFLQEDRVLYRVAPQSATRPFATWSSTTMTRPVP